MSKALATQLAEAESEFEEAESALGDVWDVLVDLDETTSKADLLEAVDSCIEMISDYDPDQFVIEEPVESEEEAAA